MFIFFYQLKVQVHFLHLVQGWVIPLMTETSFMEVEVLSVSVLILTFW